MATSEASVAKKPRLTDAKYNDESVSAVEASVHGVQLLDVEVESLSGDTIHLQVPPTTSVEFLISEVINLRKMRIDEEMRLVLDCQMLKAGQILGLLKPSATRLSLTMVCCKRWLTFCGNGRGHLQLWDLNASKLLCQKHAHANTICCISVDWSSLRAITGSADRTLFVWENIEDAIPSFKLLGHKKCVSAVEADWLSNRAVSCGADGLVLFWDLASGSLLKKIHAHSAPVSCLAVSWTSRRVLSGSWDGSLRVWETEGEKMMPHVQREDHPVCCVAVCWDIIAKALSGTKSGHLIMWDLSAGKAIWNVVGHTQRVSRVSVDWFSLRALSAGWDGIVKLWDLKEEIQIVAVAALPEQMPVSALAVAWAEEVDIVSGNWGGILTVWKLGQDVCSMPCTLGCDSDRVTCIALDTKGSAAI